MRALRQFLHLERSDGFPQVTAAVQDQAALRESAEMPGSEVARATVDALVGADSRPDADVQSDTVIGLLPHLVKVPVGHVVIAGQPGGECEQSRNHEVTACGAVPFCAGDLPRGQWVLFGT